jgi:hypothetical protein
MNSPPDESGDSKLTKKVVAATVTILILIAVGRILLTYRANAQGFDEPCHVAAAIELPG